MTKLYAINFFIVQWFFIRICRVFDDHGKQIQWGLIGPVLPLTGWNVRYIGRPRAFVVWSCDTTPREPIPPEG